MKLTQADYDARKNRVVAGDGSDEDRRLVKHYEREGFVQQPRGGPVADAKAYNAAAKTVPEPVVSTTDATPTVDVTKASARVSKASAASARKA